MTARTRSAMLAVACALACALAGCSRRVVVDPSQVAQHNDRAWTVTSEPVKSNR